MFIKSVAKYILNKMPLKNVIIFSSLNDFDCNAGTVFRYMLENGYADKYTFVWNVINLDSLHRYAEYKNVHVYMESSRSFLKRYYFYVAKYLMWDNHPLAKKRKEQISIYTTHGVPPLKTTKGLISINDSADYALCPSEQVMDWEAREYAVDKEKLFICDQPRNDYLFKPKGEHLLPLQNKIKGYNKTILWMPTFRKRQNGKNDSQIEYYLGLPVINHKSDLEQLDCYLRERGILLIIKIHPQQLLSESELENLENIFFMKNSFLHENRLDINEIMPETDALLTDYSSVIWDYLLLNRPIGFTIPDIQQYSIGFAVDDVRSYMPGDKIENLNDLYEFADSLLHEEDKWTEQRDKLCKIMHDYQDGNNCKRLIEHFGI